MAQLVPGAAEDRSLRSEVCGSVAAGVHFVEGPRWARRCLSGGLVDCQGLARHRTAGNSSSRGRAMAVGAKPNHD
jgi:hypothetical protein